MPTSGHPQGEHTWSSWRDRHRSSRRSEFSTWTPALVLGLALVFLPGGASRENRATLPAEGKSGWQAVPFSLSQVTLEEGILKQKQERMLRYARDYGGTIDPYAGPDRLLSTFRANAGLDTKGAEPVGGWETATGYLRGHYAGHFMSLLAQGFAGTGDAIYKEKLDYMVDALAECQAALAEAASLPTPRVSGLHAGALKLSGSPLGHAEHVRLPSGHLGLSRDLTLAPGDLEAMQDNWIGRRQFPQRSVSYLKAALDDFLVLSRALSAEEVFTLMHTPEQLAGNDAALDILTGIGDWVYGRLAPLPPEQLDRMWDIYIAGEYGGINESLAALHDLVPEKPEYLEAAQRFVNRNVFPPIAANEDVLDGRHANQHIPQFTGYLRIFEQNHDPVFLAAAENFWNMIVPERIYSHGGVGVGEMLRGRATAALPKLPTPSSDSSLDGSKRRGAVAPLRRVR